MIRPIASRAVPRWAVLVAHIAALTPLPSAIWRVALVLGCPGGYTHNGRALIDPQGSGAPALLLLSVLSEAAALMTLGLVSSRGYRWPLAIPGIGGRPVDARAVTTASAAGAILLFILWTPLLGWWAVPHPDLTVDGSRMVGLLYLPLVAWAPLLAVVTLEYHRRHRALARGAGPGRI
ncbi:hypothetical protein AB3M89_03365 [Microbacterium sp. 179-I 3D2 NHS]|uniref:hypothetical protein n=1 Tax=Microbacterium sp. 179-I 3D2 NHS TaxID=3235178 RepID=UPI0039A2E751